MWYRVNEIKYGYSVTTLLRTKGLPYHCTLLYGIRSNGSGKKTGAIYGSQSGGKKIRFILFLSTFQWFLSNGASVDVIVIVAIFLQIYSHFWFSGWLVGWVGVVWCCPSDSDGENQVIHMRPLFLANDNNQKRASAIINQVTWIHNLSLCYMIGVQISS